MFNSNKQSMFFTNVLFIVITKISHNFFSSLAIFSDFPPSLICALPADGNSSPVFIGKTRPMLVKSTQNSLISTSVSL